MCVQIPRRGDPHLLKAGVAPGGWAFSRSAVAISGPRITRGWHSREKSCTRKGATMLLKSARVQTPSLLSAQASRTGAPKMKQTRVRCFSFFFSSSHRRAVPQDAHVPAYDKTNVGSQDFCFEVPAALLGRPSSAAAGSPPLAQWQRGVSLLDLKKKIGCISFDAVFLF